LVAVGCAWPDDGSGRLPDAPDDLLYRGALSRNETALATSDN
jgi:hypothetical protein